MSPNKNWRSSCFLLLLLVTGISVTGCKGRGSAVSGDGPDVMARVNDYKVTRSEVDKAYNTQVAGAPQKPNATEEEAMRLQVLDTIIHTRLILEKAEKLGIKAGDDEVETKLNQAKGAYTSEQFQKRLKDLGLTEDTYKEYLRHGVLVEHVMDREIKPKLIISDADVTAFYNQNKGQSTQTLDDQLRQKIHEKLRSQLEQLLRAAYVEGLRNSAEIHNYYAEQVLSNHKPESK